MNVANLITSVPHSPFLRFTGIPLLIQIKAHLFNCTVPSHAFSRGSEPELNCSTENGLFMPEGQFESVYLVIHPALYFV